MIWYQHGRQWQVITTDWDGTWTVETEWGRRWLARWHSRTPSCRAPCMSSGSFIFTIVSTICHQTTLLYVTTVVTRMRHTSTQSNTHRHNRHIHFNNCSPVPSNKLFNFSSSTFSRENLFGKAMQEDFQTRCLSYKPSDTKGVDFFGRRISPSWENA